LYQRRPWKSRKIPAHRKRASLDNLVNEKDIIFTADNESGAFSSDNGYTLEDDDANHDVGKEPFLNFCRARDSEGLQG
jgi:hypothetical protein